MATADAELRRLGRIDGYVKVSGQAEYTGDLQLPGMLHGEAVRSPYPHARIQAIRTAAAAAVPGVHAVITGDDIPFGPYGRSVWDTPALARGVVRFAGERVAAIVAESPEAARAAAALVAVDYEPLPAVLEPEEALSPDAPPVHAEPWRYRNAVVTPADPPNLQSRHVWSGGGDVAAALAAADRVFTHTFRTQTRHQGYLEPHACVARVSTDGIHIWAANKAPFSLRARIADWTGTPREQVHIHPVLIGGDFGGKGDFGDIPLCVVLAQRTGRPVRMRTRYSEDLMAANPRHPAAVTIRLGVDRQGRICAADVQALLNGGAYGGYKPLATVNLSGIADAVRSYRIPAVRVESVIAYTHTVPRGHMRAPGSVQGVFAMERMLDLVAGKLGKDPVQFRQENMLQDGDHDALGAHWLEVRSAPVLAAVREALTQASPLPPAPPGAPDGGDWASGTGLALYSRHTHTGEMEVALQPRSDGTLGVWVGFTEQGSGQFSVARNVVCQSLGLAPEWVSVHQSDTDGLAYDSGTGGSRVTVTASEALTRACGLLRRRMMDAPGTGLPDPPVTRDALAAFAAATGGQRVTAYLKYDDHEHVTSFCAQAARVWVDRGTGQVEVADITTAIDVANVVNPLSHMAQVVSGIVSGYGDALLEDLTIEDGKVSAANLGDYKLPSVRDLPAMPVIIIGGGKGIGKQNIKAIGELTNVAVPAAIANAVAAAVGVQVDRLPVRAEQVFSAMHHEEANA